MSPKKKNPGLKKIQTLVSKNLNLRKFKVNPTNVIEDTKNKTAKSTTFALYSSCRVKFLIAGDA